MKEGKSSAKYLAPEETPQSVIGKKVEEPEKAKN
jgi:hypothetical protein